MIGVEQSGDARLTAKREEGGSLVGGERRNGFGRRDKDVAMAQALPSNR